MEEVCVLMRGHIPFPMRAPFDVLEPSRATPDAPDIHPLTVVEGRRRPQTRRVHRLSEVYVEGRDREHRPDPVDHWEVGDSGSELVADDLLDPRPWVLGEVSEEPFEVRVIGYWVLIDHRFEGIVSGEVEELAVFDDRGEPIVRGPVVFLPVEDRLEGSLCRVESRPDLHIEIGRASCRERVWIAGRARASRRRGRCGMGRAAGEEGGST